MVKILQVVGKMHYGGMETLIMNVYRNINREKVQFDFMVHYEEPGEYDDEIRDLGGHIYVMPNPRPQNYFKCKRAYEKFFAEHHDYAMIHAHIQNIAFLFIPVAKKYNIWCILHIHHSGIEKTFRGYLGKYCTKMAVRMTDDLFVCSKEAADFFMPSHFTRSYKIIKNGIMTDKFLYNNKEREQIRKSQEVDHKFVMICVARFSPPKNHDFLIDIVNEMHLLDKNIVLWLVGVGPLEDQIKDKVKDLELDEYVRFWGARGDVNNLLQAADCCVMPSLWEGLALTYIESQAAGLRVFTSEEALSPEAKITDLIEAIPLSVGAEKWAEYIYSHKNYKRENQKHAIEASGFDIKTTANYLQNYYLKKQ